MELETNIFRIFISLWYLPPVKVSKKIHEVRVTCPGWFNMELPNEAFFLLETVAMITLKILSIFIAAVVREIYSFIKIMQPISPNYNWENGVKQIKIIEENLLQICILCQLLRTKTLASGSKYVKHFYNKITKIKHKKIFFIKLQYMFLYLLAYLYVFGFCSVSS